MVWYGKMIFKSPVDQLILQKETGGDWWPGTRFG
jgi:hypothetical protein